jgi:hypothetical protein
MNCYVEVTELHFVDGLTRKLVLNVASIRDVKPWAVGTLLVGSRGLVHVQESVQQIRQLVQHAREYRYATMDDIPRDPDEALFPTPALPGAVYARNTIRSKHENLTLNEVDLVGLIEQHDRMGDEIRADALGE